MELGGWALGLSSALTTRPAAPGGSRGGDRVSRAGPGAFIAEGRCDTGARPVRAHRALLQAVAGVWAARGQLY